MASAWRRAIWLASLLGLFCASSAADTLRGRVIGITDGDTITVLDDASQKHKVRLAGIDAPERKQAYSEAARQNLARLVFQQTVEIDYQKRDRYRRLVGTVYLIDDDVNLKQIDNGFAWHFVKYAHEQSSEERVRYQEAEASARAVGRGLWRDAEPVAPWDYRASAGRGDVRRSQTFPKRGEQ